MRTHRSLLVIALLACVACTQVRVREDALIAKAIDAAGGQAALQRAQSLHWTGDATAFAGDRRIELGVDSTVVPFERASSTTWLRDKRDTTQRRMVIDGDSGWIERDGRREPMAADMLANERPQYATYGLMRLVTLRDPGTRVERRPDRNGLQVLHVEHPKAAPADLFFDATGRLVALEDRVPDAEPGVAIAQRFTFDGVIEDDGVRWPRVLRIDQNGTPFFELRLATLDVAPAH
ncbi:hypothetical protein [Cognatilysobacter terrigena]|uniref:hypothetical protein n=1 Tax=Cognatilysobacter terrigena TaxID=2488749 RepID=UPI00105E255B|nr:hypothetical protein [Lysobacter terrigena]